MTDYRLLRSFRMTVCLMSVIRHQLPACFDWRPPHYEYEYRLPPIDILFGDTRLCDRLDEGTELATDELDDLVRLDLDAWRDSVQEVVLYGNA